MLLRPSRKVVAVLVAALVFALAGCGLMREAYPSPEVGLPDAKYLYRTYPSELGGEPGAPTGVEFERAGVRFTVSSPRGVESLRDAGAGAAAHPEPVCRRERAAIVIPPVPWIFTTDTATERFVIELAMTGADPSFDPSRVTLESDASGGALPAISATDSPGERDARRLRFEAPCDPGASYTLRVAGVARDGISIDVPAIRFAPAATWIFASINGGVVVWPLGAHW